MALLPRSVRRLTPHRVRDDPRLRALAVGLGAIPPRTLHSGDDLGVLLATVGGARRVVEIGVYEGASAVALASAMGPESELHLVDPFGHHPDALPSGWAATEWATRRVVARAARRRGPRLTWHVALSQEVARDWTLPVDLVFVDGDHSEAGVARDWDCWHRFVAAGGHVVFHDARAGRPGGRGLPGPTAVVERLFRSPGPPPGWELAAEADRTVAVRRLA